MRKNGTTNVPPIAPTVFACQQQARVPAQPALGPVPVGAADEARGQRQRQAQHEGRGQDHDHDARDEGERRGVAAQDDQPGEHDGAHADLHDAQRADHGAEPVRSPRDDGRAGRDADQERGQDEREDVGRVARTRRPASRVQSSW